MFHDEKSETIDREELRQLQIERLQSTLHRVYRNVAFYRHAFDAAKADIESVRSLDALRGLPFTTRENLRKAYPYDLFAVPLREIVRIHSVAGPTSQPIAVGYTRNDLRNWTDCSARLLAAAGITPNDVVQIMFHDTLFTGGFGFHQGAEKVGSSVIPSPSGAVAEKQVRILRDYKTTTIVTTPSYALKLALALEASGIHPERLQLKTAVLGGEPWSEGFRAEIEGRLRVAALDAYGISEVVGPGAAGECRERKGLHLNEDHFIAEAIDPKTLEPVRPGTEGELVLTTLTREGFPLIRFRTGDLTVLDESRCPCGRTFARMAKVSGRTDDRFFFGGIGLFPAQIEEVLREALVRVPHCRIVLDRVGGVDAMEVEVELSEEMPLLDEVRKIEMLRQRIARRIEELLEVSARVAFVEPQSLVREGEAKGKVLDRRPR
jgi:phenylacetate-CoA ligase